MITTNFYSNSECILMIKKLTLKCEEPVMQAINWTHQQC